MAETLAAPLVAFALAAMALLVLRNLAARLPQALPNARSLHGHPVPRAGGWAIWAGFVPVAWAWAPAFPGGTVGWLPALAALVIVSAIDDVRPMPVRLRLAVHLGAAAWSCAWLVREATLRNDVLASSAIAMLAFAIVAFLVVAWSLNLYNFMDGSDGLAAVMAMVGFAAYAVAGALGDRYDPAYLALAAAVVPFLAVNRPPASMFMGDVGAVPLGFLAAAFGIAGIVQGAWPPWFPALVFLPFWADASVTLLRRIVRRERVWEAHRGHYYQRLVRLGAGHGGTLALYSTWMVATAASAEWFLVRAPGLGYVALVAWVIVAGALFAVIDYHWRRQSTTSP
jgi:UDP-GlcNAc:undecaprenyl-phosphate/decaprenyl-phosphate GlcNAc-1-phosphate transferase